MCQVAPIHAGSAANADTENTQIAKAQGSGVTARQYSN